MVLYGESPDNWCAIIRDSFRLNELRGSMPAPALFVMIALPAMIVTPVGEEILFQGLIQRAFSRRWNAAVATVVNTFSFGLIHLHVHGIWRDGAGVHVRLVSSALIVCSDGRYELCIHDMPPAQRFLVDCNGCAFGIQLGHDRGDLFALPELISCPRLSEPPRP